MQSGLAVNPQNFRDLDSARGITLDLAARVNCSTNSSESLKACLQNRTAEELVRASEKLRVSCRKSKREAN